MHSKNQLDWSRAVISSSHVRAARRVTDGQGIPLAVSLTGGNRNDVTQLLPLLDKVPADAGGVGRPTPNTDAPLAVHVVHALLPEGGRPGHRVRRILTAGSLAPGAPPVEHGEGVGVEGGGGGAGSSHRVVLAGVGGRDVLVGVAGIGHEAPFLAQHEPGFTAGCRSGCGMLRW